MSSSLPLLEIEGLRVTIRTRQGPAVLVDDVSLVLAQGECLGIIGESGSGKTTLARAILCDLPRQAFTDAGAIRFAGRPLAGLREADIAKLRRNGMAMVHQQASAALNPVLSVGEQLREVPRFQFGATDASANALAIEALAQVQIADADRIMSSYPHQLSGGQLQRVAIAMALLSRPRLLVLDEPTTGLDATVQAEILQLLSGLRRTSDLAVLYISHDVGVAAEVCDRICVLYAGQIVESGATAAVLAAPLHPYTRGLVRSLPSLDRTKHDASLRPIPGTPPLVGETTPGCRFAARCEHVEAACRAAPIALQHAGTGQDWQARCRRWAELPPEDVYPAPIETPVSQGSGEILLSVKNLNKLYRRRRLFGASSRDLAANRDITLDVRRNEVLAVIGESGSGKSTFARIITGLEVATSGSIVFDGADIARMPVRRRPAALRRAIQLVSQSSEETLNPSYTVGWQIGRALRRLRPGFAGRIGTAVGGLLEQMRLPLAIGVRLPRTLSGGQKQRVSIARATAGEPKLLVADEPVSALDVSVQAAIIELLVRLQREQGVAILLVSHDLAVVHHIADRVAVLYHGTVLETGTTRQVFSAPFHPYTEVLLSAATTIDPARRRPRVLLGEARGKAEAQAGCVFATRCPRSLGPVCFEVPPPERRTAEGLRILCHIELDELARSSPPVNEDHFASRTKTSTQTASLAADFH